MGKLAFLIAAIIGAAPCFVLAQEPTTPARLEPEQTPLRLMVSIDLGSLREVFGRVTESAHIAGGIVITSGCGEPVRKPFYEPGGISLAAALDRLTTTYPEYDWTAQDGAVNLLPKRAGLGVLNLRISEFEWDTGAHVRANVGRVFGPSVRRVLAESGVVAGLHSESVLQNAPPVVNGVPELPRGRKLKIENVTVLSALNAVVSSYGQAVWVYEEQTCDGRKTYWLSAH